MSALAVPTRRSGLERWGPPVAAGLVIAFAVYFLVLRPHPGYPRTMDLLPWWVAGRLVLDGRVGEIYSLAAQGEYQTALLAPFHIVSPGGALVYNRPPFFTYPFVALALLPYDLAYVVWTAGVLATGAAALWLIAARVYPARPGATGRAWLSGMILAFAFFPVFQGMLLGQTALLELLLVTAAFSLYRAGREGRAGAVLGLLAFKPQLLAFFALALVLRRAWRALAGGLIMLAVLGLLALALVGPAGLVVYLDTVAQVSRFVCTNGVHLEMHQSLRGLAVGLLVPRCAAGLPESALAVPLVQADALAGALGAVVVALLAAAWWRGRGLPATDPRFDLLFAVTSLAALLASPYVHPQDLTLLVLVVALLLRARAAGLLPAWLHLPGLVTLGLALGPLVMSPAAYSWHPLVWLMAALFAVLSARLLVAARRPVPVPG